MEFHVVTHHQGDFRLPGEGPRALVNLETVDWIQEFAVVADMGEQRTGGYALLLRSVAVENGEATVDLEVRRPAPGSIVMQVLTRPTLLIRIPRAGLVPDGRVTVRDQEGRRLAQLQLRQ